MNPNDYPRTVELKNGKKLSVRPLLKGDQGRLLEYFQRLPENEVSRLKNDVTNPAVVERMIYDLDYDSVFPLVAMDGERIVANAALIFNPVGWTRHQAEIRGTVDPEYRLMGISTEMMKMMFDIAGEMGLEQLTAEVSPELDQAYYLCEKAGFKEAAVLKNFIKDHEKRYEDLVIMIRNVNDIDDSAQEASG